MDVQEREPFVQAIEQRLGRALTPPIRNAFLRVPRHLFVPYYYEQQGKSLSWDLVQGTPEQVYRDEALVTQLDGRGMPSSSSSQPSVMAAQLEALSVEPGQRVLEIGVGTGYNAALLGRLVGNTRQVISIDSDEHIVEQAKQHLTSTALHNILALPGDGFLGEATYAPYDRLITTCSIRGVPRAWFDQLKPGGRVVGNWQTHLASLFVCLDKKKAGELEGGLLDLEASYMEMHPKDMLPVKQKVDWTVLDTQPSARVPLSHMKTLLQNPAYSLLLQCLLPEMRKRYRNKGNQVDLYLVMQESAILVEDERLVIFGDAGIGQRIQRSVALYHQLGQPHLADYHVTFQEQHVVIALRDHCFIFPVLCS